MDIIVVVWRYKIYVFLISRISAFSTTRGLKDFLTLSGCCCCWMNFFTFMSFKSFHSQLLKEIYWPWYGNYENYPLIHYVNFSFYTFFYSTTAEFLVELVKLCRWKSYQSFGELPRVLDESAFSVEETYSVKSNDSTSETMENTSKTWRCDSPAKKRKLDWKSW